MKLLNLVTHLVWILTLLVAGGLLANSELDAQLEIAIRAGDVGMVKKLLAKGAEPDSALNANGITPLMYASWKGNREVVTLLVQAGASVKARDIKENTPLMWATKCGGCLDLVNFLLEHGSDANEKNSTGETPLIVSSNYEGNEKVIEALIEQGVDINAVDIHGNTALIDAAYSGLSGNAKMLLRLGASEEMRNKAGFYAWMAAGSSGDIPTMLLFGWKETLIEVSVVSAFSILAGLLFYPFLGLQRKSNSRRSLFLKRVFCAQIASFSLFGLLMIVLGITGIIHIPAIVGFALFGVIGILGTILSIAAIWLTRPKNHITSVSI